MACNTYKAELRAGHTNKYLVWTQVNGGSYTDTKVSINLADGRSVLVQLGRIRTQLTRVQANSGQDYPATVFYAEEMTLSQARVDVEATS